MGLLSQANKSSTLLDSRDPISAEDLLSLLTLLYSSFQEASLLYQNSKEQCNRLLLSCGIDKTSHQNLSQLEVIDQDTSIDEIKSYLSQRQKNLFKSISIDYSKDKSLFLLRMSPVNNCVNSSEVTSNLSKYNLDFFKNLSRYDSMGPQLVSILEKGLEKEALHLYRLIFSVKPIPNGIYIDSLTQADLLLDTLGSVHDLGIDVLRYDLNKLIFIYPKRLATEHELIKAQIAKILKPLQPYIPGTTDFDISGFSLTHFDEKVLSFLEND